MTIEERRLRLIEWLEVITKDVQDLLLDQFIFREFQNIVKQNPQFARSPGLFTQWMASGYAQATAVGIRRHAKESKNSISLMRFLTEVKDNPELITRQNYIKLYQDKGAYIHMGQNDFDSVAGAGNDRLPISLIEQQIDDLQKAVHTVERYVDKRIAHYDIKAPVGPTPTFGDLSDALATMEKLLILYLRLLTGKAWLGLLPTIQFEWMSIFRFPWVTQPDLRNEFANSGHCEL
jgi:HEPN superfamily AbiU2-like protein